MATPEPPAGAADPFDPFGQWKGMRDRNMEAWSKMMQDFVNSDAYASAIAQWLDVYLTRSQLFQQAIDQAMTRTLSQYRIPSTDDFMRLSDRITNIEMKLDDLDARLDEILGLLKQQGSDPAVSTNDTGAPDPAPVDAKPNAGQPERDRPEREKRESAASKRQESR